MKTEIIPLRDDKPGVYMETYLIHDSAEFQTGRRRPAVVICPGGGYMGTSDREAEPVALRFVAHGYHAFVVRYSVQTVFPAPIVDLARAIAMIRNRADEWRVEPARVAVCGFSAGGHLAAAAGVFWNEPWLYELVGVSAGRIKPNALILGYPLIDLELIAGPAKVPNAAGELVQAHRTIVSMVLGEPQPPQALKDQYRLDLQVSATTPPTFLWHTAADQVVPVLNSLRFAAALDLHAVPFELHVFESGIHGLALADDTTEVEGRFVDPPAQVWIDLALKWLGRQGGPAV